MSRDLVTQESLVIYSWGLHSPLAACGLWEARGCPIASPEEDWLRAEEELRGEQADRDEVVRARSKRVRAHRSAAARGEPPSLFRPFGTALICHS